MPGDREPQFGGMRTKARKNLARSATVGALYPLKALVPCGERYGCEQEWYHGKYNFRLLGRKFFYTEKQNARR